MPSRLLALRTPATKEEDKACEAPIPTPTLCEAHCGGGVGPTAASVAASCSNAASW